MVGWIEKNRWIKNGLLDGYTKWMVGCINRKNRWFEGSITNMNIKQMDGRMDGYKQMDGWMDRNKKRMNKLMDRKIYQKQMDG